MLDFAVAALVACVTLQFDDLTVVHCIILSLVIGSAFRIFESIFTWKIWCGGFPFSFAEIPQLGKILPDDQLFWKDFLFVNFNRHVITPAYVVCMVQHCKLSSDIDKSWMPPLTLPLQMLALYFTYDAVYVPFHRFLHLPEVYPWIHKHHHRTIVPHRGTFDGINAHPVEFAFGEFLHLFSINMLELVFASVGARLNIVVICVWLVCTSLQASLNHTLFNVRVPGVFEPRDHGVHHKLLRANYFQYVRWWDVFYGTYISGEEMISKTLANKAT